MSISISLALSKARVRLLQLCFAAHGSIKHVLQKALKGPQNPLVSHVGLGPGVFSIFDIFEGPSYSS